MTMRFQSKCAVPTNTLPQTSSSNANIPRAAASPPAPEKLRRDDWMTMPPVQDDLAARMDPTKIRAKGFNTGTSAKNPASGNGGGSEVWNETPEQRAKRLRDEVLGTNSGSSTGGAGAGKGARRKREEEAEEEEERVRAKRRAEIVSSPHPPNLTFSKSDR